MSYTTGEPIAMQIHRLCLCGRRATTLIAIDSEAGGYHEAAVCENEQHAAQVAHRFEHEKPDTIGRVRFKPIEPPLVFVTHGKT